MSLMTMAEYSRHADISRAAVTQAAKRGRIAAAVVKDPKTGQVLIDSEKADELRSQKTLGASTPKPKPKPKKPPKPPKKPAPKKKPHTEKRVPKKPKTPKVSDQEKKQTIEASGVERCNNLTDAQKLDREYQAALRKLEYEQKSGELLPAGEVKIALTQHIKSAQTTLLGIKAELSPIVAEYLPDIDERESVLGIVDSRIRQALEELEASGI